MIGSEAARLRGAWAEVSLANLRHNLRLARGMAPGSEVIGVVKADAYGHGAVEVSKALVAEGARRLAVATVQEGLELREAGVSAEIIVLGMVLPEGAPEAVERGLTLVLSKPGDGESLSRAAVRRGVTAKAFVALETGMGREGFMADEDGWAALRRLRHMPGVSVTGIMSHMACADGADLSHARGQTERFRLFVEELHKIGYNGIIRSLAASAGMARLPESHFEAVRPGVVLYGCPGFAGADALGFRPVMSVKAKIASLRRVPAGFTVSYGADFVAERESLIGVLPLGYADGLDRRWGAAGAVIVRGRLAPVAGRICMDMCMADLTDVPGAGLGDEAVVIGSQGGESVTAVGMAEKTGTISHEVLCAFGRRLPRLYDSQNER